MKRPMAIGIDDFKKVRESYYFVDKTFFLKELINAHSEVTLCTRPRRFGKTLTLSMVNYFFDCENAEENSKLFEGLEIAQAGDNYMAEQGKYPVVFLTLKGVKELEWEECYKILRRVIQEQYLHHKYLLMSDKIKSEDKQYIASILNLQAEPYEYRISLKKLTDYLYQHHGVKPILLIDEYDVPIQYGFEYGYYDKIINFMKVWLDGGLKGNTSLEFAILTGVLRVAKESIFSDLNNLEVNSIVRGDYQNVFGFTQTEVEQIAKDYEVEDKIAEIKQWYDGYHFGKAEIYNPWSVINYFRYDCEAANYWLNTSGNKIIRDLLDIATIEMRAELTDLFKGKLLETTINEGLVYDEVYKRKDALYTMLLTTGYLTIIKEDTIDGNKVYQLDIPNLEIRQVYRSKIMDYLADEMAIEDSIFMMRDLIRGDSENFARRMNQMLIKMMSYYDAKKQDKEGFYHGLMLGLTAILGNSYRIKSNRESGYGRFDLAIFPKDKTKTGVIMEFKTAETEAKLDETAQQALAQIEAKEYAAEFNEEKVAVQKYGIAFCGKKVKLLAK